MITNKPINCSAIWVTALRLFAFIGFATIAVPSELIADEAYIFMKMQCHPQSRSVSIKVFYNWNESGKAEFDRHEKDTYEMESMSGKPINCDLGDKLQVTVQSYIAHLGLTDNISVDTPDIKANGVYYLNNIIDGFDFDFKSIGDGKYNSKYCSSDDNTFKPKVREQFASQFREHKKICKLVDNGRITYTIKSAAEGSE